MADRLAPLHCQIAIGRYLNFLEYRGRLPIRRQAPISIKENTHGSIPPFFLFWRYAYLCIGPYLLLDFAGVLLARDHRRWPFTDPPRFLTSCTLLACMLRAKLYKKRTNRDASPAVCAPCSCILFGRCVFAYSPIWHIKNRV